MLVSLTVGKVDAGVAVLLTEDKRLVSAQHRFPTASVIQSIPEGILIYKQERHIPTFDAEMLITIPL